MFPEMRRKKQQLSREETENILRRGSHGVLALSLIHISGHMKPPPSSCSPEYSTADWPAAGASTGWSQTMRSRSPSGYTVQSGFSHLVCRTRTLALMGALGGSMSQLKSRAKTSLLKSSSHRASSTTLLSGSMRETYSFRPSKRPGRRWPTV